MKGPTSRRGRRMSIAAASPLEVSAPSGSKTPGAPSGISGLRKWDADADGGDGDPFEYIDDKMNYLTWKDTLVSSGSTASAGSITVTGMNLDDFDVLHRVGKGCYGRVLKVLHSATKKPFALKTMRKDRILKEGAVEMVLRERQLLAELPHNPFVVQLHFSFTTEAFLYLGMNYVPGGTLKALLQNSIVLSEKMVRFYAAEIAVGLTHLHSNHVIHRDLKLDNVLLDEEGHVVLTDLGMARSIAGELATTHCGTPEYLSYEVAKSLILRSGDGYDQAVDWWCLGIAIYEMLVGRTPFVAPDKDIEDTVFNIYSHTSIAVPRGIKLSDNVRSLLEGLLDKNPETRFGPEEMRAHPFFEGIDWDAVAARQLKPPYLPREPQPKRTRRRRGSVCPRRLDSEEEERELRALLERHAELNDKLLQLNTEFTPFVSDRMVVLHREGRWVPLVTTADEAAADEMKEDEAEAELAAAAGRMAAAGVAAEEEASSARSRLPRMGRRGSEVLALVRRVLRKKPSAPSKGSVTPL